MGGLNEFMWSQRWLAVGILVSTSLLAGGVVGTDEDVVSSSNIWTKGNERLHVPIWPATEPSVVAAAYRDEAVDWVYYDAGSDAIILLEKGQGDPVKIFDDWGDDRSGDRNIRTLSAAWLDGGELHVYVVETRQNPLLGHNEAFGFHAWWGPAAGGSEVVDPPGLPDFWDSFTTGLRSDGNEVALALGSFWITDLFLPTGMERGVVYTTQGGAFEAKTEMAGYKVERAIPWEGDVIACGGRNLDGEVAIARRSTGWEWEPVSASSAAMPSCDIAVAGNGLNVFFYGLPLIGDGGGGEPGSGDSADYQVAHQHNGAWEVEDLGHEPFRGQWLMATPQEHFIVFYSKDGEHNQQTLLRDGKEWTAYLSVDGGDPDVVTRPRNPSMLVEHAHSDDWDHDGWAVLELVLR